HRLLDTAIHAEHQQTPEGHLDVPVDLALVPEYVVGDKENDRDRDHLPQTQEPPHHRVRVDVADLHHAVHEKDPETHHGRRPVELLEGLLHRHPPDDIAQEHGEDQDVAQDADRELVVH